MLTRPLKRGLSYSIKRYKKLLIKNWSYIIFCTALLLAACTQQGRVFPSLSETYRKTDRQPFGSYIAYKEFNRLFDNRYVETVTEPFDVEWNSIKNYQEEKKYSLYFLITKNLVLNYSEVNAFMDYVKAGNDLFIAADYVDTRLLDNINCNTKRDSEIINETKGLMRQTKVSMYFGNDFKPPAYHYYYYPFLNSFTDFDTSFARVLGVNDNNEANYIILFQGKGRIYLDVAPRAFSNYFLLTGNNHKYIDNVISYLRPDPQSIYWDEYYKNTSPSRRRNDNSKPDDNFSSLAVIKQHPPLFWAFWLAIAGMLLFILFNIKRKQRIIAIVPPNVNTTVTFTETVGRLYLQKKDNSHIAEKMITYFYEHLRSKYFLSTEIINEEFIKNVSRKSGVAAVQAIQLFSFIQHAQLNQGMSDDELTVLNKAIENFYKNQT